MSKVSDAVHKATSATFELAEAMGADAIGADTHYSAGLADDLLVSVRATMLAFGGLRAHVKGDLELQDKHFDAADLVARLALDAAEVLASS